MTLRAQSGPSSPPQVHFEISAKPIASSTFRSISPGHIQGATYNDRIKDELGVKLLYPNYRAGLAAVLNAENET